MNAHDALIVVLLADGAIGTGYRYYRYLKRRGPLEDVLGQIVLAVLLALTAVGVAMDVGAARWIAVGFGFGFALIVMPIWVLAVFIPGEPRPLDHVAAGTYWAALLGTGILGLAAG